jgi:hypothetical protein
MFYTLDTETRGFFGSIFAAGLYNGKRYTSYTDNIPANIWDYFKAKKVLRGKGKRSKANIYCYVHNLEFDLAKLFEEDSRFLQGMDWDNCLIIRNRIVKAAIKIGSNKIIFKDSYSIFPSSLDKLSKSFAVQHYKKSAELEEYIRANNYKDKNDFFSRVQADDPMLQSYLQADCISLHEIISAGLTFSELSEKTFNQYVVTAANLAMMVFKHSYEDDYDDLCEGYTNESEADTRQAYYGGRCEVIKNTLENGYHYDVNSLYPYIMKNSAFPVGDCIKVSGTQAEKVYRSLTACDYGKVFCHVKVRVDPSVYLPVLPLKRDGKLLFPTGEFSGWWTWDELAFACTRGTEVIEVCGLQVFNKCKSFFSKYIKKCEYEKINSIGAKREFYKLLQNTLYGKTGQRRERLTIKLQTATRLKILEYKKIDYINVVITNGITCCQYIDQERRSPYIKPHVAAMVTARARMLLFKGIEAIKRAGGHIYYYDTDSLVSDMPLPSGMIDDKEYGKYKLEGEIEQAIFLQPKVYAEKMKGEDLAVKMKGVPKMYMPAEISWYAETLQDLARYQNIEGDIRKEIFTGTERYKIMTAIKKQVSFNQPILIRKAIILNAPTKRAMNYDLNDSLPLNIQAMDAALETKQKDNYTRYQIKFDRRTDQAYRREVGKVILSLGGVQDRDYEFIPPYLKRRGGYTLGELTQELNTLGYIFADADQLYEFIC